MTTSNSCRFCSAHLKDVFIDLNSAPPSNAFLNQAQVGKAEARYPLRLYSCGGCGLVQLPMHQEAAALFTADYVYYSSYSKSWLAHAERYVAHAVERLKLSKSSRVIEIASNDGYLLQYFVQRGIPCLGIEPTAGTAAVARTRGVETIDKFFGLDLARELVQSRGHTDLLIGNNVFAHVPDLNDFTAGLAHVLAPRGSLTLEFPHLLELVRHNEFDTIYHEHYSYFSLATACAVLAKHGLRVWDVETLSTHGGSLRLWIGHHQHAPMTQARVLDLLAQEQRAQINSPTTRKQVQQRADQVRDAMRAFLKSAKAQGQRVVGYGAAAKGNTLLNYAGINAELLPYVADASPHKQGRWLPGSQIPVVSVEHLINDQPDIVLILPWNLREEITRQLSVMTQWGGRFAVAIPQLEVFTPAQVPSAAAAA